MPSLIRLFTAISIVFTVACEQIPESAEVETHVQVGTRSFIQWHGQELIADITAIENNLVTTEIRWQDQLMSSRDYYRGLYPVSGLDNGYQFELDFDEEALSSLFPLAAGKSVSFGGTLNVVNEGASQPIWVYMTVQAEKSVKLPSGNHKVFVVDIVTEYQKNGETQTKINTVYYSPDLMMVLKSVMKEEGHQSYWRVTSVVQPRPGETVQPRPIRRKSGTVMI